MAINFEAANMAGYNNPKIEVFKAATSPNTDTLISAPRKTELIKCLTRGSIPVILQTSPDGSESNLLWITTWATDVEGDSIYFSHTALIIMYTPDSDIPIASAGG